MLFQGFVILILFLLVPLTLGRAMAGFIRLHDRASVPAVLFWYVIGQVMMWAVFEAIGVLLVYTKQSLHTAVTVWCLLIGLLAVVSVVCIVRTRRKAERAQKTQWLKGWTRHRTVILLCALIAAVPIGIQCYMYAFKMHVDEDDSRYIVNAVEAYENDELLVSNPATGDAYVYEKTSSIAKDTVSPWMMYIALLSKLMGTHPAIFAHTLLPVILICMVYMVYWLMAYELFHGKWLESFIFVLFAAWINMHFGDTTHTQATVALVRIWQGKAVVAAFILPLLLYCLLLLYREGSNRRLYLLLAVANMGACLLSGVGIFFAGIMIGTYGVCHVLATKRWRDAVYVFLACIPTILYGFIYVCL